MGVKKDEASSPRKAARERPTAPGPGRSGPANMSRGASDANAGDAHEEERHELAHSMTRGALLKFGSQAIIKALSLVYQIIILRLLSPVEAGIYFLVNSFVAILLQVMAAGLPVAAVRYTPMYISQNQKERVKSLVWTLSVATMAWSVLVLVLVIFWRDDIARFYGQPIGPAMFWIAILSLLTVFYSFWTSMLDGLKQFGRNSLLQVVQQVLRFVLTVAIFYLIARTSDIALGVYALTLALPVAYLMKYLWDWLGNLPGPLEFSWPMLYESLRFGIPASLSGVADILTTNMDVIMVGSFLGLEAVAAYSAMVIFVRNIAPFVISPVSSVQGPLLVEQYARAGKTYTKLYTDLVREGSRWTMYLGVPFLGVFLLYSTAILEIVSPKYVASANLIWFFTPMVLLVLLSNSSRGALFAQGRSGVMLLLSAVILVFNFALNWMLIPIFGLMGSALATSFSVVLGETIALVLARRMAGAKLHPDILKCLVAGILMVGIGFVPLPVLGSLSDWAWHGGAGLAAIMGVRGWGIIFSSIALGIAMSVSGVIYLAIMLGLGAFSDHDRRMAGRMLMRYLPVHTHPHVKRFSGNE